MDSRYLIAGVLEVVASERPDLLGPLVDALAFSPIRGELAEVAKLWSIRPEALGAVAAKASKHLDRLAKRRSSGWRHPDQVVGEPNVPALAAFAAARRTRWPGTRGRRFHVLAFKLHRIAERERLRREFEVFMREPVKPVDPEWLRDFMRWGDG